MPSKKQRSKQKKAEKKLKKNNNIKSQEQKQEAYTILASFLSDKKRSLAAKTGLSFTAPGAKKGTSLFAFTEKIWQQVITRGEEL